MNNVGCFCITVFCFIHMSILYLYHVVSSGCCPSYPRTSNNLVMGFSASCASIWLLTSYPHLFNDFVTVFRAGFVSQMYFSVPVHDICTQHRHFSTCSPCSFGSFSIYCLYRDFIFQLGVHGQSKLLARLVVHTKCCFRWFLKLLPVKIYCRIRVDVFLEGLSSSSRMRLVVCSGESISRRYIVYKAVETEVSAC
ncbi:hypothetical protein GYMLUDRAFT_598315 [Collybiopsis luxurians FD-317 M1]|uniref:Uncharacterized protein n=1 Tax=Collybiopsis luxurians FD-317 M1 TaxID=944289 RepID=A0A0D0BB12_9AGAR|nr:hypothetical protein GYMLUDRAFT_598315 [Collybiopsis luxurians FD-317 M1]